MSKFVHAIRNVLKFALAVIATTIAKVGGTGCVPFDRKRRIDRYGVCILHDDIRALDIGREVEVLAVQNK